MRYLEDFTPGQIFRAGPIMVGEEEIIAFASRYDPQMSHTDPIAAKGGFFKGLTASGFMTTALFMRLFLESGAIVSGEMVGSEIQMIRWHRPVRPGDSLRLELEVQEAAPSETNPIFGWILLKACLFNQKDELVQTLSSRLRAPVKAPRIAVLSRQ